MYYCWCNPVLHGALLLYWLCWQHITCLCDAIMWHCWCSSVLHGALLMYWLCWQHITCLCDAIMWHCWCSLYYIVLCFCIGYVGSISLVYVMPSCGIVGVVLYYMVLCSCIGYVGSISLVYVMPSCGIVGVVCTTLCFAHVMVMLAACHLFV